MALTDTPMRPVPETPQERRDAAMSFGDVESVVFQALLAFLGDNAADDDGMIDIWICDLSTDWVVWRSWSTHGPGPGLWRLDYSLGTDNTVTFSGDPQPVVEQTTYLPVEGKKMGGSIVVRDRRPADDDPRASLESRGEARKALVNVRETRRCSSEFELREVADGTGGSDLVFTGFACVTNADYGMSDWLGDWTERIAVGAFTKTLRDGADVAFLVNHEGLTLARTKPGTLKLSEVMLGDPTGLHSEARLDPKNPYVQALRSAVEREDVDEMSFAFRVPKDRQVWDADYTDRTILECNLQYGDVSAVNFGANPHTAGYVGIRGRGEGQCDRIDVILSELRAGRTLPDATMAVLSQVSEMLTTSEPAARQEIASDGEALARAMVLVARNRERESKRRRAA